MATEIRAHGSERRYGMRNNTRTTTQLERGGLTSGIETAEALFVNCSKGGACLEANIAFNEGEVIRLNRPMDGSGLSTPDFAEVRWLSKKSDKYLIGLQFLG